MNLFHETENKYYELLTLMINKKDEYSEREVSDFLESKMVGEIDYEVVDSLFSKEDGEEAVFMYDQGSFVPSCLSKMPIRNTSIEDEALWNISKSSYARHFLSENTLTKIAAICSNVNPSWDDRQIFIRNQFEHGALESVADYAKSIQVITKAIQERRAIKYDNIQPGKYEYIGAEIYPVVIEYSFINDIFRVAGFDSKEHRFIKMTLSSMDNIELLDSVKPDVQDEYKEYIDANTIHVVLDVEPKDHVIERCFRIFSYYDRKASYEVETNTYKLDISYLSFDEGEVIRDILSLGGSVVVLEPRKIQREVFRRIKMANDRYID